MITYNRLKHILADGTSNKYKPGDFGYWWTVELDEEDIEGKDYTKNHSIRLRDTDNVTSLYGCPKSFKEDFLIINTDIASLKYAPKFVGGHFACESCKNLISLEGAPERVGGGFSCYGCHRLTSLEGAPKYVENGFDCNNCKNLISLEGAPKYVEIVFNCNDCCKLTSLEGLPERLPALYRNNCPSLTSLEGAPKRIERDFECWDCPLKSLDGIPNYIGKNFIFNSKYISKEDIDALRRSGIVKGDIITTRIEPD